MGLSYSPNYANSANTRVLFGLSPVFSAESPAYLYMVTQYIHSIKNSWEVTLWKRKKI